MLDLTIRPEGPADLDGIRRTIMAAFGRPQEADLVAALQANGKTVVSLVAIAGDEIVGHVLFSPVTLVPDHNQKIVGLAPLSVCPAHQRRGIGSALVRAGLHACREAGAVAVVVLGDPEYYCRFGFTPGKARRLHCEYQGAEEAFQVIELQPGALAERSGLCRYGKEFSLAE